MTRHYELLFVLKPTLVEEELQAKVTFLKEILEKNGAEIAALQDMGTKKLAYQVQKFERGYYGVFYFTAPTDSILEVERNLRISEDFLKFMTVKYEKQKEIRHWNKVVEKFTAKEEVVVAKEETPAETIVAKDETTTEA
ncbi:30S ribosomal protein S6 [Sulfurospirillum arcachonense]|uniref:30S ribosomal protein S6 n=1 Tax=Sulfurospirillum arcachonense TaxID=57666 RepID=UPI0004695377|nr:30S ribosomal protein S6 [Sulfurospirillum arcachonense]